MLQSWYQKNCLSTGKHVIIFVTQQVTIGAAWPAKTPLILALITFNLKNCTVKPVLLLLNLGKQDKVQRMTKFEQKYVHCTWASQPPQFFTTNSLLMTFFQMIGGQEKKDCPPPLPMPQCIGPGYFVVLIVAQLFMLIGYIGYKNQKEAAAKKFF